MTFNTSPLSMARRLIAAGALAGPAFCAGQAHAARLVAVRPAPIVPMRCRRHAAAHPGTTFDTWWLAFNDYRPKLGTEVAGGNAADVYQMDYRYLVEYARRGSIAPLDEYVGKGLDLSAISTRTGDGGKVDGKLYAISLGANSVALVVNQSAFEAAGVEMPTRDWTWRRLQEPRRSLQRQVQRHASARRWFGPRAGP